MDKDDVRYITTEIGSVRDAILDLTTVLTAILGPSDLAASLDKLTERFNVLSDCYEGHLVDWHSSKHTVKRPKLPPVGQPKFGPLLNDAKPTPLCPHCDEPMVCSNRICTGKALPDLEGEAPDREMVERYAEQIEGIRFIKDECIHDYITDILRQFAGEVRRG